MKLKVFKYSDREGQPQEWKLEPLELQQTNLIVGRNATGKSRTINTISTLARLLSGRLKDLTISGNYEIIFTKDGKDVNYKLKFEDRRILHESLFYTGDQQPLLERGQDGSGKIFFEKEDRWIDFQSPPTQVAVSTRQDSVQHPFLQDLVTWGHRTFHYAFGLGMGHQSLVLLRSDAPPVDFHDTNQVVGIFKEGVRLFGKKYAESIIKDMSEIGYEIDEIGTAPPEIIEIQTNIPTPLQFLVLYVKEKDRHYKTEQMEISSGMFRALSTIINVEFGIQSQKATTVLIDDIGEGLDFERSESLIKLIYRRTEHSGVQLVMTTNDRFVMNSIPIRYWSVLKRSGHTVHVANQNNSKGAFEDFKFTGLNNFDFFASDYVGEYKN